MSVWQKDRAFGKRVPEARCPIQPPTQSGEQTLGHSSRQCWVSLWGEATLPGPCTSWQWVLVTPHLMVWNVSTSSACGFLGTSNPQPARPACLRCSHCAILCSQITASHSAWNPSPLLDSLYLKGFAASLWRAFLALSHQAILHSLVPIKFPKT